MPTDVTPSNLLYTPEQKIRRDNTVWTLVQGVLAPVQFLIFLVSLILVIRSLWTGEGTTLALSSVVVKTIVLYTIMITGCIWEKVVFGKYLFAEAFFWEDVFSMLVLALHTTYVYAWLTNSLSSQTQLWLALAAYTAYCINAGQFVWKLRAARLQSAEMSRNRNGETAAQLMRRGETA
jgi:3-vinyl bacteriochlorophyllide hydratase